MATIATRDGTKLVEATDDYIKIYCGDSPVIQIDKKGFIYVEGNFTTQSVRAAYGLRELLKHVEKQNIVCEG